MHTEQGERGISGQEEGRERREREGRRPGKATLLLIKIQSILIPPLTEGGHTENVFLIPVFFSSGVVVQMIDWERE